MEPLIPQMHRSAAGPGLIIDYLIFDHFDSFMTLSERAARVRGDSFYAVVDTPSPWGLTSIRARLAVGRWWKIEADEANHRPPTLLSVLKEHFIPANRDRNRRAKLGNWAHLVISNCGLQDKQK
jgi:hypothetical protein